MLPGCSVEGACSLPVVRPGQGSVGHLAALDGKNRTTNEVYRHSIGGAAWTARGSHQTPDLSSPAKIGLMMDVVSSMGALLIAVNGWKTIDDQNSVLVMVNRD
ncbi:hypothetical protein ACLOJK_006858 [Asimina triloba]